MSSKCATSCRSGDVLLDVNNLSVRFDQPRGSVWAVTDASLTVKAGEVTGLVGESASGTSTIGKAIMGLVPRPGRIVSGSVMLNGVDLRGVDDEQMRRVRGREIGMIFQDPQGSFDPLFTIGDQIKEALSAHLKLRGDAAHRRCIDLLERVRLPNPRRQIDAYPHQLSGGMQQRAAIAMALSCDPKLLIADEPTTALDVTTQAEIIELFGTLQRELKLSILLISHDMGVVSALAHRLQVMYAGYIVEEGTTEQVLAHPKHPYTTALLASVVRLDQERSVALQATPGGAATMKAPAASCPFRPRCPHAFSLCATENPALTIDPVGSKHRVACHLDA